VVTNEKKTRTTRWEQDEARYGQSWPNLPSGAPDCERMTPGEIIRFNRERHTLPQRFGGA
jgi:hypothetical protein